MDAPNDEGRRGNGTPQATNETEPAHIATPPAAAQIDDGHHHEKLRATLAAQLALAGGFALLQLADGSWLVSRWNCTRHLADLNGVAQFARQVGAR